MNVKSLTSAEGYQICRHTLMLQAVNEADAAVQQADKGVKRAVAASRDRSGQVKEILADLDRLQHSQRTWPCPECCQWCLSRTAALL